jgi:hypothetical protein
MPQDAFISYSRKDRAFAIRLQKALASYTPPRDLPLPHRRLQVFRDEEDFTGAEYYQSVDRHLNDSNKLIVLCSPAARASRFVDDEIRRFARARGPEHIIPLLVAGVPNNEATPEQQGEMAFPDALCEAMAMPLAADYRGFDPERSKVDRGPYEASWFTTLANLYGVSRAEIEQREKTRRARRRRITAAMAAVAVIVLAGLSFVAWRQRQDAIRQENIAAARQLTGRAAALESIRYSQGLRQRALITAESLHRAWTSDGYDAWRRATRQMPPVIGNLETDSILLRMTFTPDATTLVALCGQRHIHVFSVPDLRERQRLDASETADELAIDSTGTQALAYTANDEFVEAFDVRNGSKRGVFLPAPFRSAAFTPAGETIVTSLTHLWVIDAASDNVRTRVSFPGATSAVVLSPDGAIALALTGTSLNAYDTSSGAGRWQLPLSGEQENRDVVFRGDGQSLLVTGSREWSIVSATTGTVITSIQATPGDSGRPLLLGGDSYAIGNTLRSMSDGNGRMLPLTDERTPPFALPAVSSSGRYVAGIHRSDKANVVVVDTSIREPAVAGDDVAFYVTLDEGLEGRAAAFTADGHLLAVSSGRTGYAQEKSGQLQLVSLKPDRWRPIVPSRSRTGDLIVLPPDGRVVAKHWQSAAARTFEADGTPIEDESPGTFASPSGRFVARLERGKEWTITDTTGGRRIVIPDNGSPIEFSPDEQRVLIFPAIYALNDPASPRTVAGATPLFGTWSFPGSTLVIGVETDSMSAGDSKASVLFDWETGRVSAGPPSVHALYAVNPDGRRFATYDHDGIAIWTVGSTTPAVRSGRASLEYDESLHFSPDGTLLAVGDCGSVPLYDAATLDLRFRVPIGNACFAGFTHDGRYVVSRAWHGGAPEPVLHPITLDGVRAETCAKVRHLTAAERDRIGAAAVAGCPDRGNAGGAAQSAASDPR